MLFKECGHHGGNCPCLLCQKECDGCFDSPDGYSVDTEKLCAAARAYCENGREEGADNA